MNFNRTLISIAAVAALYGCGGDAGTPTGPTAILPAGVNPGVAELARDASMGSTAYTLTKSLGLVGELLVKQGVSISPVELRNVPNNAESVLYLNAEEGLTSTPELEAFATDFKGLIIIDSRDLMPELTHEEVAHEGDPAAKTNDGLVTTETLSPAAKFYRALFKDSVATPNGTALVTSATTKSVKPLSIDQSGRLNGAEEKDQQQILNLKVAVAANVWHDRNSSTNATAESDLFRQQKQILSGFGDRTVDIDQIVNGWAARGRYWVHAYKDLSGPRHFVKVYLFTGDNESTCYVSGNKCGIYPTSQANLVNATIVPGYDNVAGYPGRYKVIGFGQRYQAEARVTGAKQHLGHAPSAEAWTATERVDSDSYEKVYTTGWSFGGSIGFSTAGSFSLGPSASFSSSTTYRKRMHAWNGVSGHTAASAFSGVALKDATTHNGFDDFHTSADQVEQGYRQDVIGTGTYCGYKKGAGKPKMSFEGWQPSLSAGFEVDGSKAEHQVVGVLRWRRATQTYERIGGFECNGSHYAKNFAMRVLGTDDLTGKNTPTYTEYVASQGVWIPKSAFTN